MTFVLWRGLQAPLANPMLERENYRGEAIPTALGFVGVLGFVAVTAAAGVLDSLGWVEQPVATSLGHPPCRSRSASPSSACSTTWPGRVTTGASAAMPPSSGGGG